MILLPAMQQGFELVQEAEISNHLSHVDVYQLLVMVLSLKCDQLWIYSQNRHLKTSNND